MHMSVCVCVCMCVCGLFKQAMQNKKNDSFANHPDEQKMTSCLPVVKQKIPF